MRDDRLGRRSRKVKKSIAGRGSDDDEQNGDDDEAEERFFPPKRGESVGFEVRR